MKRFLLQFFTWWNRQNNRYMDDLFVYDVPGHRWVCVYPGYDTKNPPELVVNADGFEASKGGEPMPIAAATLIGRWRW